jgi:hypothetical protein
VARPYGALERFETAAAQLLAGLTGTLAIAADTC